MEDASKTCIVPLQLVQIFDLQAVKVAAGFRQCDLALIERVQNCAYKRIAKDMFGLPMAPFSAAAVSLFNRGLPTPLPIGDILILRKATSVQQSAQNHLTANTPCPSRHFEPFIKLRYIFRRGDLNGCKKSIWYQ